MNKKSILSLLFALSCLTAWCQTPAWVSYADRTINYPESEYLMGFMSEHNLNDEPEEELIARLRGYSKDQVVESILIDINSISTLNIHNVNADTHEEYKRASSTVSNASIAGLKTESYYDKRKKIGYAFSYARKEDVINYYSNQIAQSLNKVNTQYLMTKNQIMTGDHETALKSLYAMQTSLKNLDQKFTMLITLTGDYDHPGVKREDYNRHKVNIDKDLNAIKTTDQLKIDDAAFFIAFALDAQLESKDMVIRVNNFTYEDTPMTSSFSRRMKNSIEQKLIQQGYRVANDGGMTQDALVLNGTYWESTDQLQITTLLREQSNANAIASADCALSKDMLELDRIPYKPENYTDALVSMKQFATDEIIAGGLVVDIFTNKGQDNLIFTQGEELKLFVKANQECYLRFIYHLADGSQVLLLDDYYISREYVNKAYQLPDVFECAEPFGFETLQLNAQTTPFAPLNTREEYGYKFILDGSAVVLQKTRGFKRSTDQEVLRAEKRINITTMSR
ncbi:hypothetical protein BFP72_13505 [Reichenbachiella sp. 5M10]|uniref:hypothetical protein n=1 Tax=Reichenbachiella sp. 5M10 TaxID=1889772 RepID=UPI000C14CABF|nr:hypothetical protein [Reichenbachiella sp. 5M10]PIB36338.1 hypothetical protein BFP72_13505 [Reichenbachiella sp. 5M10]